MYKQKDREANFQPSDASAKRHHSTMLLITGDAEFSGSLFCDSQKYYANANEELFLLSM